MGRQLDCGLPPPPPFGGHLPRMTGEVELVEGARLHPVAGIGSEPSYLTPSLLVKKIVSAERSMARDIFTVVLLEQHWMVRFRGRRSQRYATQGEAICAAVDAAYNAGMANSDGAQVRVQDFNNVFRTEWTYAIDPLPPR